MVAYTGRIYTLRTMKFVILKSAVYVYTAKGNRIGSKVMRKITLQITTPHKM